ncbi:MAG: hypothetical protein GWO16_04570, partial [Gammaproteobacteria bacterium]|nr:hypothetical protein [Gammaproteobacteria bacterium]NIR97373.1 hypothetical protein [Gammaproteobacteria bacterium]NIT63030.1 hypothetical protein [Gammaproteobacteria bacterium]NIV21160.1 hypothetical protein [Gammaproteobacteria bacterium]NIY31610.1 hypothetical protein [Gammaproteobacteria bacterium]
VTDPLAAQANRLLQQTPPEAWPSEAALQARIDEEAERIERIDVHDAYLDALDRNALVRLGDLGAELRALPPERRLRFVADPVWGAAVPVYQRLQQRLGADVLQVLHTEDDPYFGGQTTEPNPQTLGDALAALAADDAPFGVAIRNDPDSDRGLVGDTGGAIKMNTFAAIVMRYLMDNGQHGDLVTTHPTSQMGPDRTTRGPTGARWCSPRPASRTSARTSRAGAPCSPTRRATA